VPPPSPTHANIFCCIVRECENIIKLNSSCADYHQCVPLVFRSCTPRHQPRELDRQPQRNGGEGKRNRTYCLLYIVWPIMFSFSYYVLLYVYTTSNVRSRSRSNDSRFVKKGVKTHQLIVVVVVELHGPLSRWTGESFHR
jgi:hypothetical protein